MNCYDIQGVFFWQMPSKCFLIMNISFIFMAFDRKWKQYKDGKIELKLTHKFPNFSIFLTKNNMKKCDYASSRHNGKSIEFLFIRTYLSGPREKIQRNVVKFPIIVKSFVCDKLIWFDFQCDSTRFYCRRTTWEKFRLKRMVKKEGRSI
jgi:hypothetical protein